MPIPPPPQPLLHRCSLVLPLAQDSGGAPAAILWSAVVIGICVAGFFLLSMVRKRLKEAPTAEGPAAGFTLSDLRQLHKSGQMSDEEFERARAKIVAAGK